MDEYINRETTLLNLQGMKNYPRSPDEWNAINEAIRIVKAMPIVNFEQDDETVIS